MLKPVLRIHFTPPNINMKETIIEFIANPNKTALFSIGSAITGTVTEAIGQTSQTIQNQPPTDTSHIQIIAYLAAISAGIFSIANTLKAWYRDSKKNNDEILK